MYTLVRAGVEVSAPVNTVLFAYYFFRIQKNCCQKSRKHPQQEAVKRLEFEMQRLELEQQLEDMRERMAREKKTRQQNVAHEQWVTEQKRNLQAIKIEKVGETRYPSFMFPTVFFFGRGRLDHTSALVCVRVCRWFGTPFEDRKMYQVVLRLAKEPNNQSSRPKKKKS